MPLHPDPRLCVKVPVQSTVIEERLGNHVGSVETRSFNVLAYHMLSMERPRFLPIGVSASILVHDGFELTATDNFSLEQYRGSCDEDRLLFG
jgi:hypothetical protein